MKRKEQVLHPSDVRVVSLGKSSHQGCSGGITAQHQLVVRFLSIEGECSLAHLNGGQFGYIYSITLLFSQPPSSTSRLHRWNASPPNRSAFSLGRSNRQFLLLPPLRSSKFAKQKTQLSKSTQPRSMLSNEGRFSISHTEKSLKEPRPIFTSFSFSQSLRKNCRFRSLPALNG